MTTVADICSKIGRSELAECVGVGATAISNAVVSNAFPAKWYLVVRLLCDREQIECPECLFTFVAAPKDDDESISGEAA